MSGVVNADEAGRCLQIARSALQAGNPEKAARFAEKAMKLYPSDEARKVVQAVRSQTAQASTSSSRPPTAPTGSRQRQATSNGSSTTPPPEDLSTPEQREMVRTILAKKDDLYAVLSLPRSAGDDEIKKAYRKLALKLHPDKNKAHGADEAFKVVSKAFSCLSDSDKRARYDRYGEETPGLSRTASGRPMHGEFDADEIFNAFFGGRPGPIFRTHFGGPFQRAGPEGNGQTQSPLLGLVTIAPIVLFLLFTFLSSHSDPVFTLDRTGSFVYELQTSKLNVPFFVKSVPDLDKSYPSTSVYRLRLEREVEGAYQERLSQRCYKEQVEQRRLYQWGYLTQAKGMALPSCKEFTERFGHRTSQYGYAV